MLPLEVQEGGSDQSLQRLATVAFSFRMITSTDILLGLAIPPPTRPVLYLINILSFRLSRQYVQLHYIPHLDSNSLIHYPVVLSSLHCLPSLVRAQEPSLAGHGSFVYIICCLFCQGIISELGFTLLSYCKMIIQLFIFSNSINEGLLAILIKGV